MVAVYTGESLMRQFNKRDAFPFYLFILMGILLIAVPEAGAAQGDSDQAPGRVMAQQATKADDIWITADHTKHEALKKTFKSGVEVTRDRKSVV